MELAQKNHTCANHGQLIPHPDPERWLCLQMPVELRLRIHARLPITNSLAPAQGTMASVPSAGCLLARNQYYRKASVSSGTSLTGPDSVNFAGDDKAQLGLPEVAESTWWFKSFFQSVPVLSNVKREDQSACGHPLRPCRCDPRTLWHLSYSW
ncbi:pancreatic progenitor cell differentiation and proliferation factor-like protein isoform 1-T1 [Dama dama]|uniref:pancreatic progenitor cell differentiation and proliferation factor-like protein n=1 Tax=Dama dama TaxID=30532 RepID=UPI002A3651EA|nr:pancreatic progenitor cell differentiation and proliferation factor-like protein [Dama dama]